MDIQTDEDEHSIEMHLPYVRKAFEGYCLIKTRMLISANISTL